jgi:branched-subunit amino acid transport protein
MMAALIAETQTYPVVIGAHHACWLLLQALFITASVPTVMSTTATRTMTKGLFIR